MPANRLSELGRRYFGAEDGNILVMSAFGATLLMGAMALSVDAGRLMLAQHQMQAFADAAAMAGALEINTCGSTTNCTAMQTAVTDAVKDVGATTVNIVTQCGSTTGKTGLVVQLNNGPCANSSDPNYGSSTYVEAVVGQNISTVFGTLLHQNSFYVEARAEAGGPGQPSACIYVLDPNTSSAVTFNGGTVTATNCGMQVDSTQNPAVMIDSGVTISLKDVDMVTTSSPGYTNNGGTINVTPQNKQPSISDPLASLAVPSTTPCGTSTSSPYSGSANNISVGSAVTLNPGVYCGGINFNSGTYTVTMNPGTYVFTAAVNVNGSVTLKGTGGVTMYFSSGTLQLNSSAIADLVAPTTGTYAGILYFQSRTNSSGVDLDSATSSVFQGVIYAPDAKLTMNSNSTTAAYTMLVVDDLIFDSGSNFTMNANYSSLPGGAPIKGAGGVSSVAMVE